MNCSDPAGLLKTDLFLRSEKQIKDAQRNKTDTKEK